MPNNQNNRVRQVLPATNQVLLLILLTHNHNPKELQGRNGLNDMLCYFDNIYLPITNNLKQI